MDLETVSTIEAHQQTVAGDALLIDVRRPDEWAMTGVPEGAVLITMGDPDFLAKIEQVTGGDRSRRLLFTCRTGARSGQVQHALSGVGYTNVVNVRGGFIGNGVDPGWSQAGLPVLRYQER
jgi:rhodanese-related sulfurtransferase